MKRIMANLAFAVALAAAGLSAPAAAAQRSYSVTDFDRVVVEGPYSVRLSVGRTSSSASANGSQDALDRVSVEVVGRTLRVRPNRSAWGGYPGAATAPATIELATRELRAATVTGAGNLAIDRLAGLRIDLSLQGSGRIAAPAVNADVLSVGTIGSGRIELGGTARELRAQVHGWAELDASALTAQGATLVTDSAGRIAATVAREATVTASGIGDVEIAGPAACTVRGLSAAQVRCGSGQRR